MSAGVYLEEARTLAGTCIARERARHGGNADEARDRLARRIGWAPGTLYNLMRERLKGLDYDLRLRLTEYAVEDLQNEIDALTREMERARNLRGPQSVALADKAQKLLTEAQALHARLGGGGDQ
ncbi:hypothetical protein HNR00_003553 [Methylorubrum rhodinum]|uniref:Uncharacterized protein n=1 Tax=Methylorubrum rhodinum TaxID=29428 RepID=A0A840ZMK5_9HYPH|nr:hypothetical protein [Methylorubrum rhodinum]MBB5758826.1 hypothetical protein [Methylorubrum rhodinum]